MTERLGGKELLEQYSLATLLDPRYLFCNYSLKYSNFNLLRYKNCFFNKKDAKDQAEAALLRVLKAEVSTELVSHEIVQAEPTEGLAGVLQQLPERGSLARAEEREGRTQAEEFYIQKYLDAQLENVYCLKYWEKREKTSGLHKVDNALCRLARYECFEDVFFSIMIDFQEVPHSASHIH